VSDDDDDDEVVSSPGKPSPPMDDTIRDRIMADLKELYCCRPSKEIFERTWRPDAIFEVSFVPSLLRNSLILVGSFG